MSKNKMRRQYTLQKTCSARPYWIPNHVEAVPDRMLCTRKPRHGGKHQNGQDHSWDKVGGK